MYDTKRHYFLFDTTACFVTMGGSHGIKLQVLKCIWRLRLLRPQWAVVMCAFHDDFSWVVRPHNTAPPLLHISRPEMLFLHLCSFRRIDMMVVRVAREAARSNFISDINDQIQSSEMIAKDKNSPSNISGLPARPLRWPHKIDMAEAGQPPRLVATRTRFSSIRPVLRSIV